jgi:Bacterial regulatory helix-turn-helix protein, lysR family
MSIPPPLRKLQYVLAVARELHFRRAAEGLNVSQPYVSRQIKEFEADIGFDIFRRDPVALTASGQELVVRTGQGVHYRPLRLHIPSVEASNSCRPEGQVSQTPPAISNSVCFGYVRRAWVWADPGGHHICTTRTRRLAANPSAIRAAVCHRSTGQSSIHRLVSLVG